MSDERRGYNPAFRHSGNAIMNFVHDGMWLLTNVAVAFLAPVALLPLTGVHSRYRGRVRKLLYRSVREGQLLWTVIAMCAAAMYEASVHLQALFQNKEGSANEISLTLTAIIWHALAMLVASVAVLMGTLEALEREENIEKSHSRRRAAGSANHPVVMIFSFWMAGITVFTFSATHYLAS